MRQSGELIGPPARSAGGSRLPQKEKTKILCEQLHPRPPGEVVQRYLEQDRFVEYHIMIAIVSRYLFAVVR